MDVFTAIADPVRRDLLRTLATGSARVADLAAEHPISRPAVSKHLRVLTAAGLVTSDSVGRERHYRLVAAPLGEVRALLADLTSAGAARPPVTEADLDALELEVRRTGRDRRAGRATTATATTTTTTTTEETA